MIRTTSTFLDRFPCKAGPWLVRPAEGISEPAGSEAGPSFAIKDNFAVAGWPTTAGSAALSDATDEVKNCDVLERLLTAGFRFVGRASMHELAFGVTGANEWMGTPLNPLYPALVPGGSSSGSASGVAAGQVDFAIGTDTGGSIRVPAACCGIVGFKPTMGRVSRAGVLPAATTLDCVGPLARNVAMIRQVMAEITPDWRRATAYVKGNIGFVSTAGDIEIIAHVRESAAALGDIQDAILPSFDEAIRAGLTIIGRETSTAFGHLVETGKVGRDVSERLRSAAAITDVQVAAAELVRNRFSSEVDCLLRVFDALLLPTIPYSVPSLLEGAVPRAALPITDNCRPFNLSGHPAIALPVGEVDGRPVSLQLVGRKGEDEELCALAAQIPIFQKWGN